MGIIVLTIVILMVMYALLTKNHKVLIALSVLSVFADSFRIDLGASLLLINLIGFLLFPLVMRKIHFINVAISGISLRPLWIYWIYLLILGFIFGLLFPWEDYTQYRTWGQRALGRSTITVIRYLNEIILCYYLIWVLVCKRVSLRFIIRCIGWTTVISCVIAIIDYANGYVIKSNLFTMVPQLAGRFLGLNGEPKMFGRNSALAYIIILLFRRSVEKSKFDWLFISFSVLGVVLSLSASTIIMFVGFNLLLLLRSGNLKASLVVVTVGLGSYVALKNNEFFIEVTQNKVENAIFGNENKVTAHEPAFFSRFDIFDRLGLNFLYDNPQYAVFGTGPNLISIPASAYVGSLEIYSSFDERGGIDSVPNVMVTNILASTGVIGITLYLFFISNLYRTAFKRENRLAVDFLTVNLMFNMVYFSIVFIFLTAIVIAVLSLTLKSTK